MYLFLCKLSSCDLSTKSWALSPNGNTNGTLIISRMRYDIVSASRFCWGSKEWRSYGNLKFWWKSTFFHDYIWLTTFVSYISVNCDIMLNVFILNIIVFIIIFLYEWNKVKVSSLFESFISDFQEIYVQLHKYGLKPGCSVSFKTEVNNCFINSAFISLIGFSSFNKLNLHF